MENEYRRVSIPKWSGDGAQGRNRTSDTVIFSHVLYQLSYLGIQTAALAAWVGT